MRTLSRLSGRRNLPQDCRKPPLGSISHDSESIRAIDREHGVSIEWADQMTEHDVCGVLELPVVAATHFRVDGRHVLMPIASDEDRCGGSSLRASTQVTKRRFRDVHRRTRHGDPASDPRRVRARSAAKSRCTDPRRAAPTCLNLSLLSGCRRRIARIFWKTN